MVPKSAHKRVVKSTPEIVGVVSVAEQVDLALNQMEKS